MIRKRYHISLYVLVPLIFSGISILSSAGAYWIACSLYRSGTGTDWPVWLWGIGMGAATFVCGLVIARLILKPVKDFVQEADSLALLPGPAAPPVDSGSTDEIEHFTRVFERVTEFLSRAESERLFPDFIGRSEVMRGLFHQVLKVAPTDSTVLITGESGTGKELVANALYEHSLRKGKPFVKINCVAIPEGLLESELFGHEKGAFTGAVSRKPGKFEIADGGTIFLDEIGDMALTTQAKVLRVLQEREFERVGGNRNIKVDVRIIAASNRDLLKMVREERFREDLYYRLNVIPLHLPPLRDRKEDIPLLADYFLGRTSDAVGLSPEASELLLAYSWPGNVRELQNALERAAVMADSMIRPSHLPSVITSGSLMDDLEKRALPEGELSIDDRLRGIERGIILEALRRAGGVQVKAAQLLGISPRSLWHRVKKLEIDIGAFKELEFRRPLQGKIEE
ncbi:MAG TPA: sigma 54-interacting transcriptional regulator [Syntrophobacteraceae bacterium]|nr:sigma 54-interacting transcriptional regulator [Syntrophobacteraceae bacterium]